MDSASNKLIKMDRALAAPLTDIDARSWVKEHAAPYKELMAYYRCAMMEVETRFKVLNEDLELRGSDNPIESIKTRLKSPESIVDKLFRKGFPLTVESIEENLYDVAGVRVICSFCSDVYAMAKAFLSQSGITLVRKRDYIQMPKMSGYRSLNLVVSVPIFLRDQVREMKVEVQLRTLAMDCWASLEHKLRYKKQPDPSGRVGEELLACAEIAAALDQRFEEIHLQTKEVGVDG
jgi:putative GTP pyrophosphokinase